MIGVDRRAQGNHHDMGCLRRILGTFVGSVLIAVGVPMLVLPGPGLPCVIGGFLVLGWAWHRKRRRR